MQDNRRCVSVNDIRRAFEKAEQSLSESVKCGAGAVGIGGLFGLSPSHHRMSSLDSTTSDESSIPTPHNCYGSVSSLISGQTNLKDHYGSITSLASSTSLISPQVNTFSSRQNITKTVGIRIPGFCLVLGPKNIKVSTNNDPNYGKFNYQTTTHHLITRQV